MTDINESTALATRGAPSKSGAIAMSDRGVQLQTLDDAWRFAQYVVKSGRAPDSITTPEQALVAMQAGMELGFSPMRSLSAIVVVKGKPSLYGEAALALIHDRAVCSRPPVVTVEGEGEQRRGVVRFQRKDMPEPLEVTFSVAEAKTAGLWGKKTSKGEPTPWILYPEDMLGWRAVSRMVKRYFGDVTLGLLVAEEAQDYPPSARAAERTAPPPSDPDPLLAKVRETAPEVIEAETIGDPAPDDGALTWLGERADQAIEQIKAAATIAGEHRAYRDTEALRSELQDKLPARAKDIDDAHANRRRELGVKE